MVGQGTGRSIRTSCDRSAHPSPVGAPRTLARRYAGRTMSRVVSPPEDERAVAGDGPSPTTQAAPVLPGTEWLVQRMHRPLERLWAHGFRFLFVLDAIALYAVMVAINLVRFGTDWPTYPLSHYLVGFAI